MPCMKHRMTYWEDYLIWKYDPKYNVLKKKKGSPMPQKRPEIEYECEPLFIDSRNSNIGFGYTTAGPRLVIDSGHTYLPHVFREATL